MLHDQDLPMHLWAEASRTMVYVQNRTQHRVLEKNELWHRRLAHVQYRALPLASKVVEGLLEIQTKHDGVCKGCAKGKNTKKTFPSSESKEK